MKKYELLRVLAITPMEAISGVFLVVAVQFFDTSALIKGLIAASPMMGFLVSPLVLNFIAARRIAPSKVVSRVYLLCGTGMLLTAVADSAELLLAGAVLSISLTGAMVPVFTGLWRQNVAAEERGKVYGRIFLQGLAAKLVFGLLVSWWLGDQPERYKVVSVIGSILYLAASYAAARIPSEPITVGSKNPLARLGLLIRNPFFGYMSFAWMILGCGNLLQFPLRTDFIGGGRYFDAYAAMWILILVDVIPTSFRIISIPIWGILFDRINFLKIRVGVNLLFATSTVFFFTNSFTLQLLAAVIFGIAAGGGNLAWNLWLTKYVPPKQTEDYMSVHVFLTGLRGTLAPMIAFTISEKASHPQVAMLAVFLMLLASALILPVWQTTERRD